jgi:hypothetical protein
MGTRTRLGLLAAGALAFAATLSGAPAHAVPAGSLSVHGRLLVVPAESPGGATSYAVALPDGDLVPVTGTFPADARTGATFTGRLEVPSDVLRTMSQRGESGAVAALRLVDRRSLALRVVGTPSVTEPRATADAATVHTQYVAALDNVGALGQTDEQLLGHVSAVGGYWAGQSDGAMSVSVPAGVTHYDTAVSPTTCGLGSNIADFTAIVQEAMSKFPGINPYSGTDQLVVFVPPSCFGGSTVGRGSIGSSFASGGVLVAESSDSIEGVYAHEAGHNYGFQHANARLSGSSLEYYGIYDVMGFAFGAPYNMLTALSTPYRVFQGITDPGEIQIVDLGDGRSAVHATATIAPRGATTGLRSVRVKDPDTGENLYLDYRSGIGQDASSVYAAQASLGSGGTTLRYAPGVTINAARGVSGNDALVLDGSGHTSLSEGATWTNASQRLKVKVTAIGPAGASVAVDYTPTLTLSSSRPRITGTPQVGHTLRARHGTWTAGTTFAYAWFADGVRIKHRSGPKLALTKAQKGSRISVRVTGSKADYPKVSRTSRKTPKVT